MASNGTAGEAPNMGGAQFSSHAWLEPVIVISIMVGSLVINRRHDFSILRSKPGDAGRGRSLGRGSSAERLLLPKEQIHDNHSPELSPAPYFDDNGDDDYFNTSPSSSGHAAKQRSCCGLTTINTPNSSRFADHFHSRILTKFPFLVEMFYWALNFATYALTKSFAARFFDDSQHSMWDLAQRHGESILWIEHESVFKFLFPVHEADFQAWFLNGHLGIMTFLNRIYSLVHIPGTVLFLSWIYFAAPNHTVFATVRRTMTLGNFAAFFIFTLWPCMPPRLLPVTDKYHFRDTVRQSKAESVWVGGAYVNQLAAMPSLHFTYAFVIGCTFLYHSGVGRRLGRNESRKSIMSQIFFLIAGILYPLLVLTVIVATANHYYMDACVAMCTVTLSFLCNKIWFILLPAEDMLLWVLRLEKPVPTTGENGFGRRDRGRKDGRYQQFEEENDVVTV